MLKAVLLDIDGTLVASNDAHAKAWAEALERFGYAIAFERIRRWIGMGGDKILPLVDPKLDDRSEPGSAILQFRQEIFLKRYAPNLQTTPGAARLLERFEAEGLLRVAATSAKKVEYDAIVTAAGIAHLVDVATTSDDADRSKPDADIVRSALQKAGVVPAAAAYVGDTPYDIEAAHRAGVPIVALECGGWSAAELGNAEAVYATPEKLLGEFETSPIGRGLAVTACLPQSSG